MMKSFFRFSSFLVVASSLVSPAFSDDAIDEDDIEAIREFINTKRQVTIKELGGSLSISGEVRTEFQATNETKNGVKQRGVGGATPAPSRAYDAEFNLLMDYRSDRTWASVKIEYDNNMGTISGTNNRLRLERAYLGGRAFRGDTYFIDMELGRRDMGKIFDSKIEFGSFYDGFLFKYDQTFPSIGDFYIHGGPFVINENRDQYGYVAEVGLLQVANTGLYTKYSIIDWDTKTYPEPTQNDRFRFVVSQLLFAYRYVPSSIDKVVVYYGAALVNTAAKALEITDNQKANWGGYVGFSIGQLRRRGDWAMDANYQVVSAQAVPDFDASGIGLGNASRAGLYTVNIDGTGGPTTRATAAGNGNFRGYTVQFDYLLTDNIVMSQNFAQTRTLDENIGPFRRYKQYEIEFIYTF